MSNLGASVTGDRYPGLGVCHGPDCGAPMPPDAYGYCSDRCKAEARRLALAGEMWSPHPDFAVAVRHRAAASASTEHKHKTKVATKAT